LHGIASGIAGDLKKSVIKELCDLNFDMTGRQYPSIQVRDLESVDLERMSGVLLKAVGTVITPDDDLESALRKALKLPPLPQELTRKTTRDRQKETDRTVDEDAAIDELQTVDGKAPKLSIQDTNDPNAPFAVATGDGRIVARFGTKDKAIHFIERVMQKFTRAADNAAAAEAEKSAQADKEKETAD
jgi:hypothetical protein